MSTTSPAAPRAPSRTPSIPTSTPAINHGAPIELDATPARSNSYSLTAVSPDLEELEARLEVGVLSGSEEGGLRAKRAQFLASRSKDPAVLVDLPQDPNADEVAAAKAVEGRGV